MILPIGNLAGVERFLFELVNNLSTAIHRGTVELNAKEFDMKLSAIYELVKLSLNEL